MLQRKQLNDEISVIVKVNEDVERVYQPNQRVYGNAHADLNSNSKKSKWF